MEKIKQKEKKIEQVKAKRNFVYVLNGVKFKIRKGDKWKVTESNSNPEQSTLEKSVFNYLKSINVF